MIYLLPGMGADHRLFSRLDLPGLNPKVLQWVPPGEGDSLGDYAKKLQPQITSTEDAVLLGVSLGGMLAVELARLANRKSVVWGKSVSVRVALGGRRTIKQKKNK